MDQPIQKRDGPNEGGVSTVIHARVHPGTQHEYEAALNGIFAAAGVFSGYRGHTVLRPGPTLRDYVIVFHFASRLELEAWMTSPARKACIETLTPFHERVDAPLMYAGLATWFNIPGERVPSKRRMAPIIWLAIIPIAFTTSTLLHASLYELPLAPRVLVTAAFQVVLLTWVLLPILTRAAARWLYR
jgi:uncharacterized protein